MGSPVDQWQYQRFVELAKGLRAAVLIEELLRLPAFNQREVSPIIQGLIDLESIAPGFCSGSDRQACQQPSNLVDVGLRFYREQYSEIDHRAFLKVLRTGYGMIGQQMQGRHTRDREAPGYVPAL